MNSFHVAKKVDQKRAEVFGGQLIALHISLHLGQCIALIRRDGMSENYAYSTHVYGIDSESFYWGHYDMSESEARESFINRVNKYNG